MIKVTPKVSIIHGLVALSFGGGLTACGFVIAPLSLATVEVASSGVKAVEYNLDQPQQAAIYARTQSVSAAGAFCRFFFQETGANTRRDLFPEDLSEDATPLHSDGGPILTTDLD